MDDTPDKTEGSTPERPKKRRRTGRACAACRRRKTRCDGGMPCDACHVGEMECSYDEPDRRMTAVEYIHSLELKTSNLEKKVIELEGLLARDTSQATEGTSAPPTPFTSRSDRRMPSSNAVNGHTDHPVASGTPAATRPAPAQQAAVLLSGKSSVSGSDEDVIETMVGAGEYDSPHASSFERYRGSFAGLSLLRRVQNLCKDASSQGRDSKIAAEDDFIHAFDFASPSNDSSIPWDAFAMLPSRANFDKAIDTVVEQACCNMRFLDRPALESIAGQVYAENEKDSKHHSRKALALIYAVLALSRRFEPASSIETAQGTRGLRYFRASRAMLDPADCHDLVSLQTLLCMILYTQVSSMMSTCYSYICMAVAASLQMGLFTEVASRDLPESEILYRRRLFSVLNMMDTYVTTALGLPRTLRDVKSDHLLPSPAEPSSMSDPMAGTYLHAQLIRILASAVESNHPVTQPISQKNGFYGVEYSKITATEEQLESWFKALPQDPTDVGSVEGAMQMRSAMLLRLAYAHTQMVLYRPFLHHALKSMRNNNHVSLKAYACGSSCIKAAMQVVWLAETLESCNLFNEAHWFTTLITSFTAACLVLFVMSNEGDPTLVETEDAVQRIKGLCYRHRDQNPSMGRCYKFLESLRPSEPTPERQIQDPFDTWSREVSHTFSQAYRLPENTGLETQPDLVQALNLPQLRTFVNNRI